MRAEALNAAAKMLEERAEEALALREAVEGKNGQDTAGT